MNQFYYNVCAAFHVTFQTRYPLDICSGSAGYSRHPTRLVRSASLPFPFPIRRRWVLARPEPDLGRVQISLARDRSDDLKSRARHRAVSGCTRSEPISVTDWWHSYIYEKTLCSLSYWYREPIVNDIEERVHFNNLKEYEIKILITKIRVLNILIRLSNFV